MPSAIALTGHILIHIYLYLQVHLMTGNLKLLPYFKVMVNSPLVAGNHPDTGPAELGTAYSR